MRIIFENIDDFIEKTRMLSITEIYTTIERVDLKTEDDKIINRFLIRFSSCDGKVLLNTLQIIGDYKFENEEEAKKSSEEIEKRINEIISYIHKVSPALRIIRGMVEL